MPLDFSWDTLNPRGLGSHLTQRRVCRRRGGKLSKKTCSRFSQGQRRSVSRPTKPKREANIGSRRNSRKSKLGHSIIDCYEIGDGKEVTLEAQLRLNVWLRSESSPKRFNHRNVSSGRRIWGNQGGKPHSSAGIGNRGLESTWKRPDDGGSVKQSGNRSWWKDGKLKSQVGEKLNLEPNERSMGKGTQINALSRMSREVESRAQRKKHGERDTN
ncbi:hypothetical protein LWI28_005844 [Acer negundo]|uniref:Uncharacterized protein n=1 Tax=Acer negundo TaxID=4023 RepID=A0AAD5I8L7_ACENE|nr:hypothetical protein LWI28_005844 [Acer negundo]